MRTVRNFAVTAALVAASFVVPSAPTAAAAVYCDIAIVWQNAYTPGEDIDFTFTPNCVMASGAGPNNAVGQLQTSLNKCHGKALRVDREFGPKTRAALIQVQQSLHITADGVYGPQTARAMRHAPVGSGACKRITF